MDRREFLKTLGVGTVASGLNVIPYSVEVLGQIDEKQKAFNALLHFEDIHAKDEITEELLGHQFALVQNLFKATYGSFVSCDPIIKSISIDKNDSGPSWTDWSNGNFELRVPKILNFSVSRLMLEQLCVLSYCLQTDGVRDVSGGNMSFFGFQITSVANDGNEKDMYIKSNQLVAAFLVLNMDLTEFSEKDASVKSMLALSNIDFKLIDSFKYLVNTAGLEISDVARPYFLSAFPAFAAILDRKLLAKNIGNGDGTGFRLFDLLENDDIFGFNNLLSTANGFDGSVV